MGQASEPPPGPIERQIREELALALKRAVERPAAVQRPLPALDAPEDEGGRPISFNAAMVRALLAGNKSQTRRPIQPQPAGFTQRRSGPWPVDAEGRPLDCRLARVGDRLWVREPWERPGARFEYEADHGPAAAKARRWRPGRFMPRFASRLTLVVRGIHPQRLHELSDQDALAEGMPPAVLADEPCGAGAAWFRELWDRIYAKTEFAWERDPWAWVIRFRVVRNNEPIAFPSRRP